MCSFFFLFKSLTGFIFHMLVQSSLTPIKQTKQNKTKAKTSWLWASVLLMRCEKTGKWSVLLMLPLSLLLLIEEKETPASSNQPQWYGLCHSVPTPLFLRLKHRICPCPSIAYQSKNCSLSNKRIKLKMLDKCVWSISLVLFQKDKFQEPGCSFFPTKL